MNRYLFCTLLIALSISIHAQEKAPIVKGTVHISIDNGTIDCDLTIEDMPLLNNYLLLLNAGMNVRNIRNIEDNYNFYYERTADGDVSYEALGYYIPDNTDTARFIPKKGLRFRHTGKFPVIDDTVNAARQDWKGNIAFNGYSVRTDGMQAAWYPVLYDIKKDKTYEDVRYDIEITCNDCNVIYLNGSKPVPGNKARFKSDIPMEMLVYAGRYKVANIDGTFFLNADVEGGKLKAFGQQTNAFKKYYEQHLGIPYKYNITYLNSTPVSKDNAWMFVSYPTIAVVGRGEHGLKGIIEDTTGFAMSFIAHELGHYYFGTYRTFNGAFGSVLGEGFAEYMSALTMKQFFGQAVYDKAVQGWMKKLNGFEPVSFSSLQKESDFKSRQKYLYYYAPVIYTAIEKEIGMDKMWEWMKHLLEDKTTFTDYAFAEKALAATLQNEKQLQHIKAKYFSSDKSLANVIKTINDK